MTDCLRLGYAGRQRIKASAVPKQLRDYKVRDWLHLRPLTQGYKTLRYDAANAAHMKKPARDERELAAVREAITGRRALVTIAFEDAEVIGWQIPLIRRYVACDAHVIADNSVDDIRASEVREAALHAGALYMRLPANKARESRSHGLALNWFWTNAVKPARPQAFGFLDHDLFPTAPDDPFAPLAGQDFFGVLRIAGERWYLWPGFCLFRFAAVADKPLDFRQDWFIGLDTGGGNWDVLYHHADRSRLRFMPRVHKPYREGVPMCESYVEWSDHWLHEVGYEGRDDLRTDKRAAIGALLAPHLTGAA